ncbi:hypothetical protein Q9Q95_13320 [Sphingomonas sp. DG1-23]|uniref:hypothetical protein n=1 Tax=Sphingomonas sp. DG1-23 TaxID=3068316 RepID=UPI00273F3D3E|nr:hypothetical protein [Sphingomonas sp. DG1-23]MDP5279909.1 hypothetical protein [Sphingomonas sp. DG1-23]
MSVARIYKVGSPYNAVELADLDYAQAFDIVYLAHIDHDPTKLVRSSHTSWEFVTVPIGPTIAEPTGLNVTATVANTDTANSGNAYFPQPASYVVTAINDDTGQESRASTADSATNDLTLKRNKNVLTWAAPTGASRYRVYKAYNEQMYGFIGETESTTFTDDNIGPDLTDAPPQAFNPFEDGNNPSSVTFFEQRLIWARTRAVPNGVYSSRSADFENMDAARPVREDDSIVFRILSQKVNAVNSFVPLKDLLALTSNGIFTIKGSNTDYLAANPPPRALPENEDNVSRLKPIVVNNVAFYAPEGGGEIHTAGFAFEIDGYQANDVTIFSPGLFRSYQIDGWAYARNPLSVLWVARSDGKMPTFTWQREQQVWGWTLCETDGTVEDVCAIKEGGETRLYLLVLRTIGGVERRFVERMASAEWDQAENSCFLDCALTYQPETPTSRFQVPHLAGATVDALADGFVIRGLTVDANGWVDVGQDVERVVTIGLPYEALIETLPLVFQTQQGWSRDKRQMLGDIVVQVTDTRLGGVETGRRLSKMYAMKARTNEPLGSPTALFTGTASASTEPVTAGEATLFIRSAEPLPLTVTAVYLDPVVSET